jgi:hypothetical protein
MKNSRAIKFCVVGFDDGRKVKNGQKINFCSPVSTSNNQKSSIVYYSGYSEN